MALAVEEFRGMKITLDRSSDYSGYWVVVNPPDYQGQGPTRRDAKKEAIRYIKLLQKYMRKEGIGFNGFSRLRHTLGDDNSVELSFAAEGFDIGRKMGEAFEAAHRATLKDLKNIKPIFKEENLRPLSTQNYKDIANITLYAREDEGGFIVTLEPRTGHSLQEGRGELQYSHRGAPIYKLAHFINQQIPQLVDIDFQEINHREETSGPCFDIEAKEVGKDSYSQETMETELTKAFNAAFEQLIAPPPPPPPTKRQYTKTARSRF
jgi:hypothetical protein